MAQSAPVLRIAGLGLVLISLAGCGGKTLWLGVLPASADGGDAETGTDGVPADASADGVPGDAGPDGVPGDGSPDGGLACLHGQVSANEVLWIGDSWILVPPGTLPNRVRDLARAAGVIGPTEDYVMGAVAASSMAAIASQYDKQEASATKVRVLLMDGGTWDTIQSNGADATVTSVANSFAQLLAQVSSDGTVGHVIYFLQPELSGIPGVAALRPPLQQACTQSRVPCHFLDLQPLWAGHPEYTASSGGISFPTETGATVIADAIWGIMRDNCIAQ
jgi:hypothetical protein